MADVENFGIVVQSRDNVDRVTAVNHPEKVRPSKRLKPVSEKPVSEQSSVSGTALLPEDINILLDGKKQYDSLSDELKAITPFRRLMFDPEKLSPIAVVDGAKLGVVDKRDPRVQRIIESQRDVAITPVRMVPIDNPLFVHNPLYDRTLSTDYENHVNDFLSVADIDEVNRKELHDQFLVGSGEHNVRVNDNESDEQENGHTYSDESVTILDHDPAQDMPELTKLQDMISSAGGSNRVAETQAFDAMLSGKSDDSLDFG